ncbi:hypothetical protein Clacol_005863 [Clathrus columnatus]|uniref:Uncharacterized protein n=1 Tax=Clathrus columnatus TaxID=1419009 RepID=A0AAV5AAH4_9AGAM|nr:hypothetical protein Clacol_005863 [Clathrus columnatus]
MFSTIRKSLAVIEKGDDEHKELTTTEADDSEACTSRKRLQADEINLQKKKKQVLRARLKELREINACINKEAKHSNTRYEELIAANIICMICRDAIQKPQRAELIDTDAESDLDEHGVRDETEIAEPAPRPRRRHQFTSAATRKKHCPYCKKLIMRRPVPNYRLREVSETLGSDLLSMNQALSAHRCRNDLWHGIFHPENGDSGHLGAGYLVEAGDAEEVRARRERERLEAFEEGRRRGVLETRQQWARAEEARRTAMIRPIQMHELRFGQTNLFRPRHAPVAVIAVPPVAAAPIPQIPDAPAPM